MLQMKGKIQYLIKRKKRNHKQKLLEDNKTTDLGVRDWAAGLPDYLIELVIKKLSLLDCLSIGNVCKSWRSTTISLFYKCSLGIPLFVEYGPNESTTRTCLGVLDNNKFEIQLPELCRGCYISGSFHDWLFLVRVIGSVARIFLFNPFYGDTISLPDVYIDEDDDGDDIRIFLNVVPTDATCICMVLNGDNKPISVCSPVAATKWHKISLRHRNRALYHEGSFYFLGKETVVINETSFLNILKVAAAADDDGTCCDHIIPSIETTTISPRHWPTLLMSRHTMRYFLEYCGEILLVRRLLYIHGLHKFETSSLEFYRLDLSRMAWEKAESLGDRILFLGLHLSRSFNAKKLVGDDALVNYSKPWHLVYGQ